jgi:hypothetical protein
MCVKGQRKIIKHEARAVCRTGLNLAPPDCAIEMLSRRRRSATCGDLNQCHVLAVCLSTLMLHRFVLGYFAILHEFINPRSYHIADCRCALFCTSWQASVNNLHPCSTEDCDGPVVWRLRGGGYVLPLHVLADACWR